MALLPFPVVNNIQALYQTDDILDFLGEGTFASVYKAVSLVSNSHISEGDEVALKIISKKDINSEKTLRDVNNEVEILRHVNHPNCVRLLDYFQTATHVVIVMNYVPGVELLQALRGTDFTEQMTRSVMEQLLRALSYLHNSLCVVHRDVKPENILVTRTDEGGIHVTLVDFGLARVFGRQSTRRRLGREAFIPLQRLTGNPPMRTASVESLDSSCDSPFLSTPCGTLRYAAPETIRSISQSSQLNTTRNLLPRIDVYAAGIIMHIMLCGSLPFTDFTNKAALYREMEKGPSFTGARVDKISAAAIETNRALLMMDSQKRPRAEEALKYPWFHLPPQFDSEENEGPRMPVDEALERREYMAEAFEAMQPPDTSHFNQMGTEGAMLDTRGGRCIGKIIPTRGNPSHTGYFGA